MSFINIPTSSNECPATLGPCVLIFHGKYQYLRCIDLECAQRSDNLVRHANELYKHSYMLKQVPGYPRPLRINISCKMPVFAVH
jgi:hypothetical protein